MDSSETSKAHKPNTGINTRLLASYSNGSTIVMFRKWRPADGSGVIALFPYEPGTVGKPEMCQSYEHVGQHGAADLAAIVKATLPASEKEYQSLRRELESAPFGYRLRVVGRTPRDARQLRTAKCR